MTTQVTACLHCSKPVDQPQTGRPRKYCSHACRTMAYDRRRLRIDETIASLHAECGGICYLCDEPIELGATGPARPSFDHVLATYRGGAHDSENIRLTHLRCNVVKSGRLVCPHCGTPA